MQPSQRRLMAAASDQFAGFVAEATVLEWVPRRVIAFATLTFAVKLEHSARRGGPVDAWNRWQSLDVPLYGCAQATRRNPPKLQCSLRHSTSSNSRRGDGDGGI